MAPHKAWHTNKKADPAPFNSRATFISPRLCRHEGESRWTEKAPEPDGRKTRSIREANPDQ
jgi:hypothetical protein